MPTLVDNQAIDAIAGGEGLLDALSGSPAGGDTIIIARNQLYTATGRQDMNIDAVLLTVEPSHRKDLTGLQVTASAGEVRLGGSGDLYECASLGAKAVWASCTIAPGGGRTRHVISDVTITALFGKAGGGLCTYGSNCDIANAYLSGGEHHLVEAGGAATALLAAGNALLRLDRDSGSLQLDDAARAIVNSTTAVLATLLMTSKSTVFDPRRCGTISTIGAAAGGARGELNFLNLENTLTVTNMYESDELTIVLPRAHPAIVTFTNTPDRTNGRARYVYA